MLKEFIVFHSFFIGNPSLSQAKSLLLSKQLRFFFFCCWGTLSAHRLWSPLGSSLGVILVLYGTTCWYSDTAYGLPWTPEWAVHQQTHRLWNIPSRHNTRMQQKNLNELCLRMWTYLPHFFLGKSAQIQCSLDHWPTQQNTDPITALSHQHFFLKKSANVKCVLGELIL